MIRIYGMAYREVMATPMRAFWMLVRNIDRLIAQEQQAQLSLMTAANSAEGVKELHQTLTKTLGEVVAPDIVEETLDRKGLNSLRTLR